MKLLVTFQKNLLSESSPCALSKVRPKGTNELRKLLNPKEEIEVSSDLTYLWKRFSEPLKTCYYVHAFTITTQITLTDCCTTFLQPHDIPSGGYDGTTFWILFLAQALFMTELISTFAGLL